MSPPNESIKHKKKSKKTRKVKKPSTNSGVKPLTLHLDKAISPGDDFYRYVNELWLKKTVIPPTKSVYGVSEEIEKRIEDQMNDLIETCVKHTEKKPASTSYIDSVHVALGTLAQSVYTADKQIQNLDTVHTVLKSIQSIQSKEEVAVILGEFLRYKLRGLFYMYGQYENKNNVQYTYTIGTGGLGLPDPTYYFKKTLHRASYLASYKHMIRRLGDLFHIPKLQCIVPLERILAGVLQHVEKDTIEYERRGSELETQFRYIPFEYIFSTMGLPHWRTRIFYVESLRWLHTLNKLFHHLGLDYWRLILCQQFILFSLPYLPPPYSTLSFQFYRKELRGQLQKLPRKKQALYILQQYATPFFSRLYVENVIDRQIKPQIIDMVQMIKKTTEHRLGEISWLEPKTREKAQEKVRKMRYAVAYPDSFEQLSIPTLDPNALLANLLTLGEWRTKYEISKLGTHITERKDWDDAVFVVNAYYYGQVNEMIIPSGILQEPFYNSQRSVGWNYGGLGCILGHEITHAFDKEGKEYNPEGFQKRWWTRSDNRNYNKQTKSLIELYSKQRMYGFPVSGVKTLSENIADIGGMGIALDALSIQLDEMKLTGEERKQAYRDFFLSYAISWRQKEKKKKRIQALILDKHAAPSLRVNLVISQFQEWYDAFNIQPSDALYIPPEKRIRIF